MKEENEEIQAKMKILKQQQFHISNLKEKISKKRQELDETNQFNQVREKEDVLKDLRRRLKQLLEERDTVMVVKTEQEKALQELKGSEDQEAKKSELLHELQETKQENKILLEKKQELEREIKQNHAKLFDGKIYVRELQKKIDAHKKRFPNEEMRAITSEDVQRLRAQIRELELDRREKIDQHDSEMRDLESMRRDLEREHERLQRILADKDREMRMNSLKLRELKRLQRARAAIPIRSRRPSADTLDMNDLNKEQQVNHYLIEEEKQIKDKMARQGLGLDDHEYAADGVVSLHKNKLREDRVFASQPRLQPVDIKTLDQITAKEKELYAQLEQLQKLKKNIK